MYVPINVYIGIYSEIRVYTYLHTEHIYKESKKIHWLDVFIDN